MQVAAFVELRHPTKTEMRNGSNRGLAAAIVYRVAYLVHKLANLRISHGCAVAYSSTEFISSDGAMLIPDQVRDAVEHFWRRDEKCTVTTQLARDQIDDKCAESKSRRACTTFVEICYGSPHGSLKKELIVD